MRRDKLDALQLAIDAIENVITDEDRNLHIWTALRDRWFNLLIKPAIAPITPQEINETVWLERRLFKPIEK